MTTGEFADLVKKMREAQKCYFKAKPYTTEKESALKLAKELENKVDKILKDREEQKRKEMELSLF